MVAKMLGTLPARSASFSNVSRTSGAACSFVSGFTPPMLGLLFLLSIRELHVSAQVYQGADESETRSGTGFSLWVLVLPRTNPQRLNPVPLNATNRPTPFQS